MSSLEDLSELVGFFGYSREDDADSQNAPAPPAAVAQGFC